MIDGDEEEAAGGTEAHRFIEDTAENVDQMCAVHLAGQLIELRQLRQLALALVALVDGAHDAMRPQRLAVGSGEPAAGVLDPDFFAIVAAEGVFDLIGNAGTIVGLRGAGDCFKAVLPAGGLDALRIGAPAGDLRGTAPSTAAALPLQISVSVSRRHS